MSKTPEEKAEAGAATALQLASSGIGHMIIRKGPLRFTAPGQMDVPVEGARITIDRGEQAQRITATRVALIGPFALLAKKDQTKLFVTIEGADDSAMLLECPVKKEGAARKLAIIVHTKHALPKGDATSPSPQG